MRIRMRMNYQTEFGNFFRLNIVVDKLIPITEKDERFVSSVDLD